MLEMHKKIGTRVFFILQLKRATFWPEKEKFNKSSKNMHHFYEKMTSNFCLKLVHHAESLMSCIRSKTQKMNKSVSNSA